MGSETAGTRPDRITGMHGAHVFRIEKDFFLVSHSSTRIALHYLVAYCAFESIQFSVALSMKGGVSVNLLLLPYTQNVYWGQCSHDNPCI